MLIVSLPPVHHEELLENIIKHPMVRAVRYNTGVSSPDSPRDTLTAINALTTKYKKPLYVDLKGKQLRVIEWANLPYGPIKLNHDIEVELPARVFFRGDDNCMLKRVVRGNEVYVDPLPRAPVGRGQSVNILSKNLKVHGGLLPLDHEYIEAALELGIRNFMLSFVEDKNDVIELEDAIRTHSKGEFNADWCELVFKIESEAGIEFVKTLKPKNFSDDSPYRLMAARDDLMIQIGVLNMPEALRAIASVDPRAICASRLLLGVEKGGVSMADLADLEYMRSLGFRSFMLSDEVSREHFADAVAFMEQYFKARPL